MDLKRLLVLNWCWQFLVEYDLFISHEITETFFKRFHFQMRLLREVWHSRDSEGSYSSVHLQIHSWLLRLIWRTTWRTDCMWRFAAYFILPASRVYGDICTIEPSALSTGILAFVEGRTGRDAEDEITAVTATASEMAKETAAAWPIRARW